MSEVRIDSMFKCIYIKKQNSKQILSHLEECMGIKGIGQRKKPTFTKATAGSRGQKQERKETNIVQSEGHFGGRAIKNAFLEMHDNVAFLHNYQNTPKKKIHSLLFLRVLHSIVSI